MSLINDALQDLEARKSETYQARREDETKNISLAKSQAKRSARRYMLVSFGVLASFSYLAYTLGAQSGNNELSQRKSDALVSSVSQELKQENSQEHKQEINIAPTAERQLADTPKNSSETVKLNDSEVIHLSEIQTVKESNIHAVTPQRNPVEHQDTVDTNVVGWLSKAEECFREYRLSLPEENNALYFIEKVLQKSPENERAIALKEKVFDRYRSLVSYAIEQGDSEKASRLLSRYSYFNVTSSEYAFYQKSIEGIVQKNIAEKNTSQPVSNQTLVAEVDETTTDSLMSKNSSSEAWVSESLNSKIQTELKLAKSALGTIRAPKATEKLELFLSTINLSQLKTENPGLYKTSLDGLAFLVDYYGSQRDVEGIKRLSKVSNSHMSLSRYIKAKEALMLSDVSAAYEVLVNAENETRFTSYDALLAALHHKMNHYEQARDLYRDLLVNDLQNPQYILGYALALDALEDYDRARSAFQDLVRIQHPNQAVMKYSRERLEVLGENTSLEASIW